ncbi:DUF4159 domain-containing protein [Thalassoroseus pseudoceratinae]|uniref:DUF4159 domain-containing protein n=1 Tax=Thalassoroseus pseudoceratinae TaxID=2713176 RepID=UPI00142369EA|nr:DUF4159 domain-containing protein [Thalassoroseus pseudoceratinae]
MSQIPRWLVGLVLSSVMVGPYGAAAIAQDDELSAQQVLTSIERGRRFLLSQQANDGAWRVDGSQQYEIGVTSLVLLALINSGMTADDPEIAKGLTYLRNIREPDPDFTYDISLMLMALSAARDGGRDVLRMEKLVAKLERSQTRDGTNRGSWGYTVSGKFAAGWTGDRSNAQYAILGLHAASEAGLEVDRTAIERARQHWIDSQNLDGGWDYVNNAGQRQPSTGSMTVAGIASLAITNAMLRDPKQDETPDGEPICCGALPEDESLEKAVEWLARHFTVGRNPGPVASGEHVLYYLYGLERAGRLSARRFFGQHDWYRRGAKYLVGTQRRSNGQWVGFGKMEKKPVIGTSLALLFLSKGLAPVLIQKGMFGEANGLQAVQSKNWTRHRWDIRHLTEQIAGRPMWPKLLTWQVLNLNQAVANNSVASVRQAPVLYLSAEESHEFTEAEAALLRTYVDQGGFILGVANCPENSDNAFEDSFRDLVAKMYPMGDASLEPLTEDHLIWRSEFLIKPGDFELFGADLGCRTPIVFSRTDLSCLWDKMSRVEPQGRSKKLSRKIDQAFQMGVNIVAYATGREPPNKLEADTDDLADGQQDKIERGLLQIAKLKHGGGWDVAPQALRNLLMGLNRVVGQAATTKTRPIEPANGNLFKYPLVYMHGRNGFNFSEAEITQLREHLQRGGVLFADSCCGSDAFDASFRELVKELFPKESMKRIPISHELFTEKTFYDIRRVRRRVPGLPRADRPVNVAIEPVEPFLEGVVVDGRLAVIYSKYDISCALQRQVTVACPGYIPEDALRIGINVVMHALLQDPTSISGDK